MSNMPNSICFTLDAKHYNRQVVLKMNGICQHFFLSFSSLLSNFRGPNSIFCTCRQVAAMELLLNRISNSFGKNKSVYIIIFHLLNFKNVQDLTRNPNFVFWLCKLSFFSSKIQPICEASCFCKNQNLHSTCWMHDNPSSEACTKTALWI